MVSELNRTLRLSIEDRRRLEPELMSITGDVVVEELENRVIFQDMFEVLEKLPSDTFDLVVTDPPYLMRKKFGNDVFTLTDFREYTSWVREWIPSLYRVLKKSGSLYVCSDWKTSSVIHLVLNKYFKVRNRITWERTKGKGSKYNWKNNSEDIWFATKTNNFTFNVDSVKLKRKVNYNYHNENGSPRDWWTGAE